ncbi:phospholipase D-like domain-containing protein [Actinomadura gamaensis]|uniref:phospholipase D n=1 Tax=Actinomadura gamaensis TaxID=1763541 RepID=A0ABV9TTT2_9ACTN
MSSAFPRLALASAALLASSVAISIVAVPPAAAAVTTGTLFNKPLGTDVERSTINTHLINLINGAAVGSTIRMSVWGINSTPVVDALIAAAQPGRAVSVQVISDYWASKDLDPYKKLAAALGTDKAKPSWTMLCSPKDAGDAAKEGACIGSAGSPKNHNKFYLFSHTSGATNVVVQSTANLTNGIGGLDGWNSASTIVGNDALFTSYAGYFADLAAQRKSDDYYTVRPPVASGNAKVYYFPRKETTAADKGDTVLAALNAVSCTGSTTVGTPTDHRTVVRVAMFSFTRDAVARKLHDLDQAGCYVDVVYTTIDDGSRTELTAPFTSYGGARVRTFSDAKKDNGVHSKYLTIEGTYDGVTNEKIVFMGSHNYTTAALRENDETLLKINDDAIHDAYKANFNEVAAATDVVIASGTSSTFLPGGAPALGPDHDTTVPDGFDQDDLHGYR